MHLTTAEKRRRLRWRRLAFGSIAASLTSVLILGAIGAYRDFSQSRETIVSAAAAQLKAQASRRVAHLESAALQADSEESLQEFFHSPWLQRYWQGADKKQPGQLYAAVVGPNGDILLHTDPSFVDRSVGDRWYRRRANYAGDIFFEIDAQVFDDQEAALGVAVPVAAEGRQIGVYHEGLSQSWIDESVAAARREVIARWSVFTGAIALVLFLGMASLRYISRQSTALLAALETSHLRRTREVGQLAAGLAHEIRNPLHAIRLNLHTLRKAADGHSSFNPDDLDQLASQSQEEIDRIDQLLRELLGYARPNEPRYEDVDLSEEIAASIEFLGSEMRAAGVEVEASLPDEPAVVRIDRAQLRQVILNLLLNAKEAMENGGTIRVSLQQLPGRVEIRVADDGCGIPENDRENIFEPFYTNKEGGSGFGLAIAKRLVTAVDGELTCESNGRAGASFLIVLPCDPQRTLHANHQ